MFCFVLSLAYLFLFTQLAAQKKNWREYEAEAFAAYKAGNTVQFVENLRQALNLKPHHPRLMYNLALGLTKTDNRLEALRLLEGVSTTGMIFPVAQSPVFQTLKDSAAYKDRFEVIVQRFTRNAAATNNSTRALEIREKGLITESIAWDEQERVFYISSVHKRCIIKVQPDGSHTVFSQPQDSLWSVLGLKVDPKRRYLWACVAALPQMVGYDSTLKGKSILVRYDLRTGKVAQKYPAPSDKQPHTFGDLALHPDGRVYVSDSESPLIAMLAPGATTLTPWLVQDKTVFESLQGIDISPDGKTLFIADYSNGLFRCTLADKRLEPIAVPDFTVVAGIDGLYAAEGYLLAIQNGTNPHRIVRLRLNSTATRVETLDVLEANNPLFYEPTLGVQVGHDFYYIANSQWPLINEKGVLAPEEKLQNPLILKLQTMDRR